MYSSFLHATLTQQLIYGKYLRKEVWGGGGRVLLHNWNLKSEIHKLKRLVTILLCTKATNIHKHFVPLIRKL